MTTPQEFPKIGIGVVLVSQEGMVLVGKRKGAHAQFYSIPGGHLEVGETFEQAAIREIKEETDLVIENPVVIGLTNNLETYKAEAKHYISIVLLAQDFSGDLKNMEPDKCEAWLWVDPKELPRPHFDASERGIDCYLSGKFYRKYE